MARGTRDLLCVLGLLIVAAAAGGCACGGFQVNILPGDDLKSLPALPVALYFAPEEEVGRCDDPGLTAARWFDAGMKSPMVERSMYFPMKVTAGTTDNRRYPLSSDFQKKTAKIYIWVDYPIGTEAAQKKSRVSVDPKRLQKCSLDIQITPQGIVVRSGGQVIASSS